MKMWMAYINKYLLGPFNNERILNKQNDFAVEIHSADTVQNTHFL